LSQCGTDACLPWRDPPFYRSSDDKERQLADAYASTLINDVRNILIDVLPITPGCLYPSPYSLGAVCLPHLTTWRRLWTDNHSVVGSNAWYIACDTWNRFVESPFKARVMITAAQLRAARALAGLDQKALAEKAGVSLPTIQRMEASTGNVRGVVDTLTKIVTALDAAGVELIGDNMPSQGTGRGVRLKAPKVPE
jgi:DNA-binding XRE family transcriptional regulator